MHSLDSSRRVWVEYLDAPNELGRCTFFLTWTQDGRSRSQIFFADPDSYLLARR